MDLAKEHAMLRELSNLDENYVKNLMRCLAMMNS